MLCLICFGEWGNVDMKDVVKRIKFEHLFAFAMFAGVMVSMIFGMKTGNNDIINTGLTILNVGFGAVVGYFFRKNESNDFVSKK